MRRGSVEGSWRWLRGITAVTVAILLGASPARAHEITLFAGRAVAPALDDDTLVFELDYQHRLGDHIALGAAYVNEGHVTGHHRDGLALQFWARTSVLDPRLTLAAGVGPYRYFDTVHSFDHILDFDDHDWGAIFNLAAAWELKLPWLVLVRAYRTETPGDLDTTAILAGIGYRLDRALSSPVLSEPTAPRNEVTLSAGRTIANTFQSETAAAMALEYRRRLGTHLEWTVAALDEGDTGPVRRTGIVGQIWAGHTLFDDRMTVGAGLGPYFVTEAHGASLGEGEDERLAGDFTLSGSYRFAPRWSVRLSWSRVFSEALWDTDVFLLGAGYGF